MFDNAGRQESPLVLLWQQSPPRLSLREAHQGGTFYLRSHCRPILTHPYGLGFTFGARPKPTAYTKTRMIEEERRREKKLKRMIEMPTTIRGIVGHYQQATAVIVHPEVDDDRDNQYWVAVYDRRDDTLRAVYSWVFIGSWEFAHWLRWMTDDVFEAEEYLCTTIRTTNLGLGLWLWEINTEQEHATLFHAKEVVSTFAHSFSDVVLSSDAVGALKHAARQYQGITSGDVWLLFDGPLTHDWALPISRSRPQPSLSIDHLPDAWRRLWDALQNPDISKAFWGTSNPPCDFLEIDGSDDLPWD